MTLTSTYADLGFAVSDGPILPPDLVAEGVAGMEAVRAGDYDTGTPPPPSPWNPGDSDDVLCKIELPQQASTALQRVVSDSNLGAFIAEATGAEAVQVWWVQLLMKPSTQTPSATSVGWHQDYLYWRNNWESADGLLTAWVALSDVTPDSGPMSFVPGSHRWGLVEGGDFFGQDNDSLRDGIEVPEGEAWTEVPGPLPPGGVSLHHSLTFHGSSLNTSGRPRRSLAVHIRTDQATPLAKTGLTTHLDNPTLNPVIYGHADRLR
ncbi:MAG: phytanoyl-CoA dioxygenase family protein [Bacteroidota bacterium]